MDLSKACLILLVGVAVASAMTLERMEELFAEKRGGACGEMPSAFKGEGWKCSCDTTGELPNWSCLQQKRSDVSFLDVKRDAVCKGAMPQGPEWKDCKCIGGNWNCLYVDQGKRSDVSFLDVKRDEDCPGEKPKGYKDCVCNEKKSWTCTVKRSDVSFLDVKRDEDCPGEKPKGYKDCVCNEKKSWTCTVKRSDVSFLDVKRGCPGEKPKGFKDCVCNETNNWTCFP